MSIVVIGINHKTAPIEIREKVAFFLQEDSNVLQDLAANPLVDGCFILSTCNRTEIYVSHKKAPDVIEEVLNQWLGDFHQLSLTSFHQSLYAYHEQHAVKHLMCVASGLDSMVLGESQILGQVKRAYFIAKQLGITNYELNQLLQKTFSVAKRIRTETKIGNYTISIAYAACLIARKTFIQSNDLCIMLIGAGKTNQLIAHYLKQHTFRRVIIANRTKENGCVLAEQLNAECIMLNDISAYLSDADIIISATASSQLLITREMVEQSSKKEVAKCRLFIDLSVPRNIGANVAKVSDSWLYTVDDLNDIVQNNLNQRQMASQQALLIIDYECNQFMMRLKQQATINVVKSYRYQAEKIKNILEKEAIKSVEQGVDIHTVIHQLTHRLTNQLIHSPTQMIKQVGIYDACLTDLKKQFNIK